jgi:hypothetical protein
MPAAYALYLFELSVDKEYRPEIYEAAKVLTELNRESR